MRILRETTGFDKLFGILFPASFLQGEDEEKDIAGKRSRKKY